MRRSLLIWLSALLLTSAAAGRLVVEAAAQQSAPMASQPAAQLDEFEQRVRDYLLNNPEVLLEAMEVLQERQRVAEAEIVQKAIVARRDEILNDPTAPVGGNEAGDVTLVEFFDYNCPYCRRVAPTVARLEKADPGLRVVYKEFPILGPGSDFAARAALASQRQGKYFAFHNALMQADGNVTEETVIEIAREVGLDTERLGADMQDPAIDAAIARNRQLASALGINGTPAFVIGDHIVPGAVDLATLQGLVVRARQN
jgi:protein-disulfide isomerase